MKLPLVIAEKLQQLSRGEMLQSSKLNFPVIAELLSEGILYKPNKINDLVQVIDGEELDAFLNKKFSISNLDLYIETLRQGDVLPTRLHSQPLDPEVKSKRMFKGFLVNCYEPISTTLNGKNFIIYPVEGTFRFIYDFENFTPDPSVTIVGVENPVNFRYVEKQKDLFKSIKPMFVCSFSQSPDSDITKWLMTVPNTYLHFGDFNFEGIGCYLNQFKAQLGDRATFYIPKNIESILKTYGSRNLYDVQKLNFQIASIDQDSILKLIELIHHYKKGLDQAFLIKS